MNTETNLFYELFRIIPPFIVIAIGLWSKDKKSFSLPIKTNDDYKYRKFCLIFGACIYLPIELIRQFS